MDWLEIETDSDIYPDVKVLTYLSWSMRNAASGTSLQDTNTRGLAAIPEEALSASEDLRTLRNLLAKRIPHSLCRNFFNGDVTPLSAAFARVLARSLCHLAMFTRIVSEFAA